MRQQFAGRSSAEDALHQLEGMKPESVRGADEQAILVGPTPGPSTLDRSLTHDRPQLERHQLVGGFVSQGGNDRFGVFDGRQVSGDISSARGRQEMICPSLSAAKHMVSLTSMLGSLVAETTKKRELPSSLQRVL